MASSYSAAPVSVVQVGSYFVGQYYKVLQQQPDSTFQFYVDASTIVRIDGDSTHTASSLMDIHNLITSMNFTSIKIKTINSLESWNGGILVMVSGSVKAKDFDGSRKFVQTFFLAPQEKGYFVLTDIFQYVEDAAVYQHQLPVPYENNFGIGIDASSPQLEHPAPDYAFEEEARKYVSDVSIEDSPADKYSFPEQQLQQQEVEGEVVGEEAPADAYATTQSEVDASQEPQSVEYEDSWEEPQKKTYASILRVAKGQTASPIASQLSFSNRSSNASNSNHVQSTAQISNSGSYVPESGAEPVEAGFSMADEGEPRSVYVRNLPFPITPGELEQEFKKFGRIKPDGIFIRQQKEVASPYVYAFVEFEDLQVFMKQSRHLQYSWVVCKSTLRKGDQIGLTILEGEEGEEAEVVMAQNPQGAALVVGAWAGGGSYDAGDYSSFRGNGVQQRGPR